MLCVLLFLLGLGLLANITPQANATLSGDNFITQITTVPTGDLLSIAVNDKGYLFLGVSNDLYRSIDNGATWTLVINGTVYEASNPNPRTIFVDSRGYIYAGMETDISNDYVQIYRSVDDGATFTSVTSNIPQTWHMTESYNGTLYVNTYKTTARVYKSGDSGATWSIFGDWTGVVDHPHWTEADPYDTSSNAIWVATGDAGYDASIQKWSGSAWIIVANTTTATDAEYQTVPIWFDENYAYFGGDGQRTTYRSSRTATDTTTFRPIWDCYRYMSGPTNFVYEGAYRSDLNLHFFSTEEGQIWSSWDGLRWVKIFDNGAGTGNMIQSLSRHAYPMYFVQSITAGSDKLFRLSIQKEDVVHLYCSEYNLRRGSLTNADNYVLEQRISNGSNYLDLTNVALSNVQASFKGLSLQTGVGGTSGLNAGFEWGNTTSFTISAGGGSITVSNVAGDQANGTWGLKVVKYTGQAVASIISSNPTVLQCQVGDLLTLSYYAKANTTSVASTQVVFMNQTGGGTIVDNNNVYYTTNWARCTHHYFVTIANKLSLRWAIYFKANAITTNIDSIVFTRIPVDVNYGSSGASIEAINYFSQGYGRPAGAYSVPAFDEGFSLPFYTGVLNTLNPSITLNSQTVSYSGTLTNGTESTPPTSLTGILTGAVEVTANIQGSGQAILRLTGTRIFNTANVILKSYTSGWYYGRYYGTPTYPTEPSALTNLEANITTLSASIDTLTFAVSSPFGTTSTTEVYVGDKGKPDKLFVSGVERVEGNGWNFDQSNRIVTVTCNHASSVSVVLQWLSSEDHEYTPQSFYRLIITVFNDRHTLQLNARVKLMKGQTLIASKITDRNNQAIFTSVTEDWYTILVESDYGNAYKKLYVDMNQEVALKLSEMTEPPATTQPDWQIGFVQKVVDLTDWGFSNFLFLLFIGIIVLAVVVVIVLFKEDVF